MKRQYLYIILLLLISFTSSGQEKDKYAIVKTNQELPDFNLYKNDSSSISSAELKGKVVFINFFATWCSPCRKELPKIKTEIWNKHKDNEDFILLLIGRGQTENVISKFFQKKDCHLPFYSDKKEKVFNKFAEDIIPRSYVVNKDGIIIYESLGYNDTDFTKIVMAIDSLLSQ